MSKSFWIILVSYLAVACSLGVVILLNTRLGVSVRVLTQDSNTVASTPGYTGFLSNIGIVFWAGTATVCLFSYIVLRERRSHTGSAQFLLASGLITGMLLLDDLFILHEDLLPRHLGTTDSHVYAVYVLIVLGYLYWFRLTILRTNFLLLAVAFAGFSISIGLDITDVVSLSTNHAYLIEDGSKIFGIASWTAYFLTASAREITKPAVGDSFPLQSRRAP